MADPLSIIGLLGVVEQILEKCIKLGLNWRDTPSDVQKFTAELHSLKTTMSLTYTNLILNRDFAAAFQGQPSAVLLQYTGSDANTGNLVANCKVELENCLEKLNKTAQGRSIDRLKAAFRPDKTRQAVEQLHRQCQNLNNLLNIDTATIGTNTLRSVGEGRQEVREIESSRYKDEVLEWLCPKDSPINPGVKHQEAKRRCQRGTGQWFLNATEYQDWAQSANQVLFCPGIPGGGKTVLTSLVVNDLECRFANEPKTVIAYLYCEINSYRDKDINDLLAALLKQLVRALPSLPESIQSFHCQHKAEPGWFPTDGWSGTLRSVIQDFEKVIFIIDALDECTTSKDCQGEILSELLELAEECGTSLFVTSRDIPEINDRLANHSHLRIGAAREDVEAYLEYQTRNLRKSVLAQPQLRQTIIETITGAVDGMFLLAKLYLDDVKSRLSPAEIDEFFESLATRDAVDLYEKAYDAAMERIGTQPKRQRDLANALLSWITYAKRPLTANEIEHAFAVAKNDAALNERRIVLISDLVTWCAGLVAVEEESKIVRFVHFTAQEYFERAGHCWFPDAVQSISQKCLIYLSMQEFANGACNSDEALQERLSRNKFFGYAANFWGDHARKDGSDSTKKDSVAFLERHSNVEASAQVLVAQNRNVRRWRSAQNSLLPIEGLHLAAHFGLESCIRHLLASCAVDSKDGSGWTPFLWALHQGRLETMRLLLDRGANTNARDDNGDTALIHAIRWGRKDKKVPVGPDPDCFTTIRHGGGSNEVIRLLLDHKADIESMDQSGRTPLWQALYRDRRETMDLLLSRGANLEAKNEHGQTLLNLFSMFNPDGMLQSLIKQGSNLEAKNEENMTPLSIACARGRIETAQLLMEAGAKLESEDDLRRTCLHMAAREGHDDVVKLLLDKGANVQKCDAYGQTALTLAAKKGHEEIVEKLVAAAPSTLTVKDFSGQTPYWWSTRNSHTRVSAVLLEASARFGVVLGDEAPSKATFPESTKGTSIRCDVCAMSDLAFHHCDGARTDGENGRMRPDISKSSQKSKPRSL